jgi:glyoxylase-like metal-dependent hydrolase (beta-lactamase superfamily II)
MSLSRDRAPLIGEVERGVHRLGSGRVNWYVLEERGAYTVVDAGLPTHYEQLTDFLAARGATLEDVAALVLTHGHTDHVGFAERLRREGVPVNAHEGDDDLLATGGGDLPPFFIRNLYRPSVAGYLLEAVRSGGRDVPPVEQYLPVADGETLAVPGSPEVVHVPGHSPGQCALWLQERETLLVGDSVVTWDVRTGRTGVPMLPAVLADGRQAFESLSRFESLGPVTLLSGHGDPWRGDASEAVQLAWTAGR